MTVPKASGSPIKELSLFSKFISTNDLTLTAFSPQASTINNSSSKVLEKDFGVTSITSSNPLSISS